MFCSVTFYHILFYFIFFSEREKQEKLKAAELLAAQSKIAELEMRLASTKTSNKRARIEFDKDLESVKYEQEVRPQVAGGGAKCGRKERSCIFFPCI